MWRKSMDWFKKLFPRFFKDVELRWTGIDTLPDGGSQALRVGTSGTCGPMDGSVGMQAVPASKGKKMVVDASKATGHLDVILYQYVDGVWVPGWAPTLSMGGKLTAELDLSAHTFGPSTKLFAWIGYPPLNTGPVDIKVSVFVERM
jgi:hypothetical protein